MRKTILLITIMFAAIFIQCNNVAASENNTLFFATTQDNPLFADRIMNIAAKKVGYNFSSSCMGMSSALTVSSTGEKDGLLLQADGIEERYPNFIRIPVQITSIDFVVVALNSFDKVIDSWDDLAGLRVGYQHQRTHIENHIPIDEIVSVTKKYTQRQLYGELLNGNIDVVVYPIVTGIELYLPETLMQAGIVDSISVYPYLNARHAELVPLFEDVLNEMKNYGTFEKLKQGQSLIESDQNTILHISSFYPDMIWESDLQNGIDSVVDLYEDTSVYTIRLNSQFFHESSGITNSAHDVIRAVFISENPDVIIASDNEAMDFLIESYNLLFPGVPIIGCSVNNYTSENYYGISKSVLNIAEDISAAETIREMLEMYPDTKNIFLLNDYTSSGRAWVEDISLQLDEFKDKVNFIYNDDVSFEDIIKIISEFDDDTLILKGFYFVDSGKDYFAEKDIQKEIVKASNKPIFGLVSTQISYGLVGGKCIDASKHGETAANIAMSLINGTSADSIGTIDSIQNIWIFDYNVMNKMGISVKDIPAGATLINKELTIYEERPWIIPTITVIFLVSVVTIFLLTYFMSKLRKRNTHLSDTKQELGLALADELLKKDSIIADLMSRHKIVIEAAPIAFVISVSNVIAETNSYCRNIFGAKKGDNIADFYVNVSDREHILSRINNNDIVTRIFRLKTATGDTRRFNISYSATNYEGEAAIVAWITDIEEDVRNRQERTELQKIIYSLPMAMVVMDAEHREVLYANRIFLDLFKLNDVSDASKTSLFKTAKDYTGALQIGATFASWETEYTLKDGSRIKVRVLGDEIKYHNQRSLIFMFY